MLRCLTYDTPKKRVCQDVKPNFYYFLSKQVIYGAVLVVVGDGKRKTTNNYICGKLKSMTIKAD